MPPKYWIAVAIGIVFIFVASGLYADTLTPAKFEPQYSRITLPKKVEFVAELISSVETDRYNQLWIASHFGIFLFDGTNLIDYLSAIGIRDPGFNTINKTFKRIDDLLYFSDFSNLFRMNVHSGKIEKYYPGTWQSFEPFDELGNKLEKKIKPWCASDSHIWSYSKEKEKHTLNIKKIDYRSGDVLEEFTGFKVHSSVTQRLEYAVCNDRYISFLGNNDGLHYEFYEVFDSHTRTFRTISLTADHVDSHMNAIRSTFSLDGDWLFRVVGNQMFRIHLRASSTEFEEIKIKNEVLSDKLKANNRDLMVLDVIDNYVILQFSYNGYIQLSIETGETIAAENINDLPILQLVNAPKTDGLFKTLTIANQQWGLYADDNNIYLEPYRQDWYIKTYGRSDKDLTIEDQAINHICSSNDGYTWYVNSNGKLFISRFDDIKRNNLTASYQYQNAPNTFKYLFCDQNVAYAISNEAEVYEFTFNERTNNFDSMLLDQPAWRNSLVIKGAANKNTLVLFNKKNLMYVDKITKKVIRKVPINFPFKHSNPFKLDHDNNFWFLRTDMGLRELAVYDYTNNVFKFSDTILGEKNVYFSNFHLDDDGFLWAIDEYGNIFRVDTREAANLTQDFIVSPIDAFEKELAYYCLLASSSNVVWASTTLGIVRRNIATQTSEYFRGMEGVTIDDYNEEACNEAKLGEEKLFLFGGLYGWTAILPDEFVPFQLASAPLILSVQKGVKPWAYFLGKTKLTSLEEERALRFVLSSPYYSSTAKLFYRVKLEGFDQQWSPSSERAEYTYMGLTGGSYRLFAQASHNGTDWSKVSVYPLEVVPLWYRSPVAYFSYVFLVISIFLIWYLRRRKLEAFLRNNLSEVEASRRRLSLALWASGDILWDFNLTGDTIYRSKTDWLEDPEYFGQFASDAFIDRIHPQDLPKYLSEIEACKNGDKTIFSLEYRIKKEQGWVWVFDRAQTVEQTNNKVEKRLIGVIHNISELKTVEDDLRKIAAEDILTGLPNRQAHNYNLEQAIHFADKTLTEVALFFIDLDRFKAINDNLGHHYGDLMLVTLATLMKQQLEDQKEVSIHRLGGDEFTIIMRSASLPKIEALVDKLLALCGQVHKIDGVELAMSFSIGVTIYPRDATNSVELMQHADSAMYEAKNIGQSSWAMYSSKAGDLLSDRLQIEVDLRKDAVDNLFSIEYQPKINLKDNTVAGTEALLRWPNKIWCNYSIESVVEVLETTGLINPVGKWIREASLEWAAELGQLHGAPLRVAINISVVQIKRGNLNEIYDYLVNSTIVEPHMVDIEITESSLLKYDDGIVRDLNKLRGIGVKIVVDDFGKGYSSIGYLNELPIDVIKIDRSFIEKIDTDQRSQALCKSIIQLAHNIGMTVIAEGVERIEQDRMLRDMKCDQCQGYLYVYPLAPYKLLEWLESGGFKKE